ncbi:MAG: hypothetical protein QF541_00390 [Lentisphaeria bacterium]|nr:hypothetical protein [Lentisphaeria bacterium]
MKAVWTLIKLAILIAVCYVGWTYYQGTQADKARAEELNRIHKLYNGEKWQESIDAYEAFWAKYPDAKTAGRDKVSQAYCHLAIAMYAAGTNTDPGYGRAVEKFLKAKEYGTLDVESEALLADCYTELKRYGEARKSIALVAAINPRRAALLRKAIELRKKRQR